MSERYEALFRALSFSLAGLAGAAACGVGNAAGTTGNATNGVLSFDAESYAVLCPSGGCRIAGWDGDEEPERNTFEHGSVTITGVRDDTGYFYGADHSNTFVGSYPGSGRVTLSDNKVVLVDSVASEMYGAYVSIKAGKAYESASAERNEVRFEGHIPETKGVVAAGGADVFVFGQATEPVNLPERLSVIDNRAVLSNVTGGSKLYDLYGGRVATLPNPLPTELSAIGNTIEIEGSTLDAYSGVRVIAAGYAASAGGKVTVENNRISISGSTLHSSAGQLVAAGVADAPGEHSVSGNVVQLRDATVEGTIYGGFFVTGRIYEGVGIDAGNRIEASGVNRIGSAGGFDTLVLTLSDVNVESPVLALEEPLDLTGRTIRLTASELKDPDARYDCVLAPEITGFTADTMVYEGTLVDYEFEADILSEDAGDMLSVGRARPLLNANAKTLSEVRLGTAAFVAQGAEFVADEGMRAIDEALKYGDRQVFGAVTGGTSRYETGSHVDVDGVTLATGAALRFGSGALGVFVEAGWASSDAAAGSAAAEGDHDYFGAGVAGLWKLSEVWRLDAALRLGRSSTEFDGNFEREHAAYDSDGLYASLHAGVTRTIPLADAMRLDLYGRYVGVYLEGDDVRLTDEAGSRYSADDVTTHAARAGLRLSGEGSRRLVWHAGLAYEHVFGGDASGTVEGLALDEPSLSGNTLIGELGLELRPEEDSSWGVRFGVKGYGLDRRGVTGNVSVCWLW